MTDPPSLNYRQVPVPKLCFHHCQGAWLLSGHLWTCWACSELFCSVLPAVHQTELSARTGVHLGTALWNSPKCCTWANDFLMLTAKFSMTSLAAKFSVTSSVTLDTHFWHRNTQKVYSRFFILIFSNWTWLLFLWLLVRVPQTLPMKYFFFFVSNICSVFLCIVKNRISVATLW